MYALVSKVYILVLMVHISSFWKGTALLTAFVPFFMRVFDSEDYCYIGFENIFADEVIE